MEEERVWQVERKQNKETFTFSPSLSLYLALHMLHYLLIVSSSGLLFYKKEYNKIEHFQASTIEGWENLA